MLGCVEIMSLLSPHYFSVLISIVYEPSELVISSAAMVSYPGEKLIIFVIAESLGSAQSETQFMIQTHAGLYQ